jgi:branched-chain amino acid transport system ATP-binding protein
MLTISGLHAFYGNIEALRGVDLEVAAGEIVTLIGANGAGKSTLLMTVCGAPRAARGEILFEGRDITRLATFEIVRLGIAHTPEGRRIFPHMTVLENLQIGATVARPGSFDEDLACVFELFPILGQRRGQRGGTLSGGEQQMLAIARAMMSRPQLLLLDEPSLGLAPLAVKQIFGAIGEINKRQKTTVLLVEQNAHHALRLADRGYVMQTGRIILSGTGPELLANPQIRAAYLGGGQP